MKSTIKKKQITKAIILLFFVLSISLFAVACNTTHEESTTETTATDSPVTVIIPDTNSITEIFSTRINSLLLAAEENEGMQIISTILPYLINSSEITESDSFVIDNFSTTGDNSDIPSEVICHDGVITYTKTGNNAYRTIEVVHEDDFVSISTTGTDTAVTTVSIAPELDSIWGEHTFEIPTLKSTDLTETELPGVFSLSSDFTRNFIAALTGNFRIGHRLHSVPGEINVRQLSTDGILRFSISGYKDTGDEVVKLDVVFYDVGKPIERAELTLSDSESPVMSIKKETSNEALTKLEINLEENGIGMLFKQDATGEDLGLYFEYNAEDILSVILQLNAEQQVADTYIGKLSMELQTASTDSDSLTIVPLSSKAKLTLSETVGEFTLSQKNGTPHSLEISTTTTIGTIITDTYIAVYEADLKSGDTVMKNITTVTDSKDSSVFTTTDIEIKLISGDAQSGMFDIIVQSSNGSESSTVTAKMTSPADRSPEFSEYESQLIERAKLLLNDPEGYREATQKALNTIAQDLQSSFLTMDYPDIFYCRLENGKGISALVHLSQDGKTISLYAEIILDIENHNYLCPVYSLSGGRFSRSEIEIDRDYMERALNPETYHNVVYSSGSTSKALAYYYNSKHDIYVLINEPEDTPIYLTEKPTQERFPGRIIHEIVLDENKNAIGDVHNFHASYDKNCIETLFCIECKHTIVSRTPVHDFTKNVTEICELNDNQPSAVYAGCQRCEQAMITLTDANGTTVVVTLSSAAQAASDASSYGSKNFGSWFHIGGTSRDLSDCRVITNIVANVSASDSFECDLIIPDLRQAVGLTILGIQFSDTTYFRSRIQDFKLVLPEGMEFIGETGERLFHSVTDLVLPETLRYFDRNAFYNYAGESLVLPASLEKWHKDGITIQALKSLTIKGEYYQSSPYLWCPNLEELILHGTFDTFLGFATSTKITELTIPDGVSVIASNAFQHCRSLERVVLPESLIRIEAYAFDNCTKLGILNIPNSVTEIGENAFRNCRSLKHVELLGVSEIPPYAFSSCSALEEVTVGEQLSVVREGAFNLCQALKKINLPENAISEQNAFNGCTLLQQ